MTKESECKLYVSKEMKRIISKLPQLDTANYNSLLSSSLYTRCVSSDNLDNPLDKIQGKYTVLLDNIVSSSENKNITTKLEEYLNKTDPDKGYYFKPDNITKVYSIVDSLSKDTKHYSYKLSNLLKNAPEDIKKLISKFKTVQKEEIEFQFKNDPLSILTKFTNRCWEGDYCERIGGLHEKGLFDDIKYKNSVVYFHKKDNPIPFGQMELKWCINDKGEKDIGIEPRKYPPEGLKDMDYYSKILEILNQKGYGNYNTCTTPYEYEGYSDNEGKAHTRIKYIPRTIQDTTDSLLRGLASDENISYSTALALSQSLNESVLLALADNRAICKYPVVIEKLIRLNHREITPFILYSCSPSSIGGEYPLFRNPAPSFSNEYSLPEHIIYEALTRPDSVFNERSSSPYDLVYELFYFLSKKSVIDLINKSPAIYDMVLQKYHRIYFEFSDTERESIFNTYLSIINSQKDRPTQTKSVISLFRSLHRFLITPQMSYIDIELTKLSSLLTDIIIPYIQSQPKITWEDRNIIYTALYHPVNLRAVHTYNQTIKTVSSLLLPKMSAYLIYTTFLHEEEDILVGTTLISVKEYLIQYKIPDIRSRFEQGIFISEDIKFIKEAAAYHNLSFLKKTGIDQESINKALSL